MKYLFLLFIFLVCISCNKMVDEELYVNPEEKEAVDSQPAIILDTTKVVIEEKIYIPINR